MRKQKQTSFKLNFNFLSVVVLILAGTLKVVAQPLTADAGNSRTLCEGVTDTLGGSPTASYGNPPYTYSWLPITGLSSSTVSNPLVNATTTITYTLTVTDNVAATSTQTLTVTVNPAPILTVSPDANICQGESTTLSAAGATVYVWSIGATTSSINVSPTTTTTYTVDGSNGTCNTSATVTVNVNPLPFANAGADITGCTGSPIYFTGNGSTGSTYYWILGDGNVSTLQYPTNYYTTAGTYYASLRVTNAFGCYADDTMIVTISDPPTLTTTSTNSNCFGSCNGTASVTVAGPNSPFTYTWTNGGTASTITNVCAGTYIAAVTNSLGCVVTDTVFINQPSPLSITTNTTLYTCPSSSVNIYGTVAGGTPPYTYNWNDGITNISTSPFTSVTPTSSTEYILTVTDASGCSSVVTDTVIVYSNTHINGQVTYSGGILSPGTNIAVLFKQQSTLIAFDTVRSMSLDAAGQFNFTYVDAGDYLVKIFPDTSVYHNMVPTYYGNQYLWDSAATIIHGCSVPNVANIVMTELGAGIGPGNISGQIIEGEGFGRAPGGPVPGIDIKLGRNPGGLFASTITDTNGNYSFSGIPVNATNEKYVVYVDIPGIGRDSSYTFRVTGTQYEFDNLDYSVDSSVVHPLYNTTIGINEIDHANNNFNLYPNPVTQETIIEYTLASDSQVSLGIYNVLGVKVADLINAYQSDGAYKINIYEKSKNLSSGVYFITLFANEHATTQKIIITQ